LTAFFIYFILFLYFFISPVTFIIYSSRFYSRVTCFCCFWSKN